MYSIAEIHFQGSPILIRTHFVEIACHFLYEKMVSVGIDSYSENMRNLSISLECFRSAELYVGSYLFLQKSIVNAQDRLDFGSLIDQVKVIVTSLGENLSSAYLNSIEDANKSDSDYYVTWDRPIKTSSLNNFLTLMKEYVNDSSGQYAGYYTFQGWEDIDLQNIKVL